MVLVFNGEIYNFIELRRELEELGHQFETHSDTEVVIEAYRRWGPACTERMEGMWALALADEGRGTLWLSRDRFGEKPLFWCFQDGALFFASEVSALIALIGRRPSVDHLQIRRFLVNGYKSLHKSDLTWFKDVRMLPPACSAILAEPGKPVAESYWMLHHAPQPMSLEEAVAGVRERLEVAVSLRLRADVPVALCLSGGIDSGALASLAVKSLGADLHCFSIVDTDPRYNEIDNIRAVVNDIGCPHHVIPTTTENFLPRLAKLVASRAAPVVTISSYIQSFLMEEISCQGFKVALTGVAADELFTGYYDHYGFWLAGRYGSADFKKLLSDWSESYGSFVRNPFLQDPIAFARDPKDRRHIYLNNKEFDSFLVNPLSEDFAEEDYCGETLRNRMLNEIWHETVPILLREDDYNAMTFSVENRAPFLDRALAEYAFSVPSENLVSNGFPKYLLREAANGLLVDEVRLDKRKRGFNASIDSLLDTSDPAVQDFLMADSPIFDIVRRDAVKNFLSFRDDRNSFNKFLFSFVSSKIFVDLFDSPSNLESFNEI